MNYEEPQEEMPEGEEEAGPARLYALGQELMDMAIAQGYSPDEEEAEEEPMKEAPAAPAGKSSNVKMALGLLGK